MTWFAPPPDRPCPRCASAHCDGGEECPTRIAQDEDADRLSELWYEGGA